MSRLYIYTKKVNELPSSCNLLAYLDILYSIILSTNQSIKQMKLALLTFSIFLISTTIYAEGTLQLITCPTCEAGLSLNDKAQFAYPNLGEDRRLHIRIGDPVNERIYVGLSEQWYVRLISPDGASIYVFDGTNFALNGTPAPFPNTISDYTQNTMGPNGLTQPGGGSPTSGSYNSVFFDPNVSGDWYIEFTDQPDFSTPTEGARCQYWDISVVDTTTPANNVINGRIWSYQWGMRSGPGSVPPGPGPRLNSTFFVYTEPEQVVTSIEIGDPNNPGWGGDWLIACNRYGVIQSEYDAGNPGEARKSIAGDADDIYGALSEYKIFMNDPDINEFPSGLDEIDVSNVALDECGSGEIFLTFNTNVEGIGDITLDFPPYSNNGIEDVRYIAEAIQVGANTIEWDRLDGAGNPIIDGTVFKIRLFIGGSIVHLPLYDIEGLTGLKAQLVRPGTAGFIGLYWDNRNIGGGISILDPGCVSSSSVVCNNYGYSNEETLNIWWNGLDVNVEADVIVPTSVQVSLSVSDDPATVCNDITGITVYPIGQSVNINSVEWTSDGTGSFDDANSLNPIYYASTQDSIIGSVTLTLSGSACPGLTDFTAVSFEDNLCQLPISLSGFDATPLNNNEHCEGNKVTWTTQTEENTDYFILESSSDGISFKEIELVNAAGNSLSVRDYVVIDENVSTKNYYRLLIHYLDGSSESVLLDYVAYSDCFRDVDVNTISDVFPNPVHNATYLKINIRESTHVEIKIKDIHGRLVGQVGQSLAKGENFVQFSMEQLEAGTYFINLVSDQWQTNHKKVIKIN